MTLLPLFNIFHLFIKGVDLGNPKIFPSIIFKKKIASLNSYVSIHYLPKFQEISPCRFLHSTS